MAKRKAISFRGITQERIRIYCEQHKMTQSGFLEELIAEKMDEAGVPVPEEVQETESKGRKKKLSSDELQSLADEYFTF